MFKELDLREAGGTFFRDVVSLGARLLDVLAFDIQLAASVVHRNRWPTSGNGRERPRNQHPSNPAPCLPSPPHTPPPPG